MNENYEEPKKSLIDQMSDNIDPGWSEPASRSDLRNALLSIDSKFDSLRTYIDIRFLGLERYFVGIERRFVEMEQRFVQMEQRFVDLERQFGRAGRLHQIEFVMIMIGFIGIILNLR